MIVYLTILIVFVSQFAFYLGHKITKKIMNKWLALFYLILNAILTIPVCTTILLIGAMGTDSGTKQAMLGSTIFLIVGFALYISILILSVIITVKSFKEDKKEKQPNN